jgi:hypothetical protein
MKKSLLYTGALYRHPFDLRTLVLLSTDGRDGGVHPSETEQCRRSSLEVHWSVMRRGSL